jgi:hypothetical protein
VADDATTEDHEYDPSANPPKDARAWLNLIDDAEKAFKEWQEKSDNIDKLYASLSKLSNNVRDREFQLFWANVEVLKPSIYARSPVPVVVPKFKDRRPLYRTASELLERCSIVTFDMNDINAIMTMIRDDLAIVARGSAWVRFETKADSDYRTERVCIEFKDRKDFLHDPARYWAEVGWVAGASYLTKAEMRKRFRKTSGDEYQRAAYAVQKEDRDNGAADNRSRAKVWEIWSKDKNKVIWVSEGCEFVLDEGEPHLKLEGFFPCPRPAYATLQRRSLVPVPDMLYYKDQLEEINEATGRIHALSQALQVRGFYPAGAGEIGAAVETAVQSTDNRRILIPISNWTALGGSAPKDTIIWLPIEQVVATITALVELRKQLIDDVYQIMGLSDIMRGSTDANETLGAQQLKSQYGSVRIRDKQAELVRVARDLVRISAEIMAENFSTKTMIEMSQLEIPTDAEIAEQVKGLEGQARQIAQQVKQAQANPQAQQMAQQNPEQAQQLMQQATQQINQLGEQAQKLKAQPTVEQIAAFLKDQKIRPFVLDIETDSTIQPDEDAEKQRRSEFMTALGAVLPQLGEMVAQEPAAAPMAGELLKFSTAPFRVGRELEGAIDEFIDAMKAKAGQPKPNPEQAQAEAEQKLEQQRIEAENKRSQAEMQMKQQELQMKAHIEAQKLQADQEGRTLDAEIKQRESDAKLQQIQAQMQRDQQKGEIELQKLQMEMQVKQQEMAFKREAAEIDQATQIQSAAIQQEQATQQADQSARAFEQKSDLAAQQARLRASQAQNKEPA